MNKLLDRIADERTPIHQVFYNKERTLRFYISKTKQLTFERYDQDETDENFRKFIKDVHTFINFAPNIPA